MRCAPAGVPGAGAEDHVLPAAEERRGPGPPEQIGPPSAVCASPFTWLPLLVAGEREGMQALPRPVPGCPPCLWPLGHSTHRLSISSVCDGPWGHRCPTPVCPEPAIADVLIAEVFGSSILAALAFAHHCTIHRSGAW
eukprot:gene12999-biopygen7546